MKVEVVKSGFVAELNGKYWGVQERDGGHGGYTRRGFGPIQNATIVSSLDYVKTPASIDSRQYAEALQGARMVPLRVTTTYEV